MTFILGTSNVQTTNKGTMKRYTGSHTSFDILQGFKMPYRSFSIVWNIGLLEWTRWHFDTLVKSHCRMWASISLHCWLIGHLDITHTQYKGHNSSSSWDNNPQTWYVVIFFLSDPMRAVMYVQDGMFTPCKISMKYVSKYISSFLSYWLSGHHHYPI